MGQPEYAFDKTFCSAALLRALAEEYGTPLLVYDRETWLGRVKLLKEAFSWAPGFRQFFPVKAAANPALWRLALQAGCGLLCSSEVELSLAAQAGGTGQSLLFTSLFSRQGRLGGRPKDRRPGDFGQPVPAGGSAPAGGQNPGATAEVPSRERETGALVPVWHGPGAAAGCGNLGIPPGRNQPGTSRSQNRSVPARGVVLLC